MGSVAAPSTSSSTHTAAVALSNAPVVVPSWELVRLWDGDGLPSSERVPLDEERVLGRRGDLLVRDASCSRRHARVLGCGAEGVLVQDLGSHNGTFVNGVAVQRGLARLGDVVRVGNTLFAVDQARSSESALADSIGVRSAELVRACAWLEEVAPGDCRILLTGETGVGKQVLAEALHALVEPAGPFVAVNCARLDERLVDSELFGHVRGAFTGAHKDRRGLVLEADGGTLFLDEVAELPEPSQARLLHLLQDGHVRPVGADRGSEVDFRLICATNVDLSERVEQGRFRADLLERICEWPVELPPLSRRTADIPSLVARLGHGLVTSLPVQEALVLGCWLGNVRELHFASRRLRLAQRAPEARTVLFPRGFQVREAPWVPSTEAPETPLEARRLLAVFEGNMSAIARHADRSREVVYRWMRRHGLR
jgi:transcriptional regulator with GAF, ATPase, and Fis domain